MAQTLEATVLQAIEKDDIKAFDALMEDTRCAKYRLGRFPVLSLLYLYSSRAILAQYEERLAKISNWDVLSEPAAIVKTFSKKAGKCLRLYLNEVVSPLEMLLILDRTKKLKAIYPIANPSKAVRTRLQTIYSIKYSLGIRYEGDAIILDRRPLNRREKKQLLTACVCGFLAVAIAVATPTTTVAIFGTRRGGNVSRLNHINFGANTTYTLTKDITLPENYSVEKMNCSIIGGGHKLILGKNASLGELSGKLSDIILESTGSPIFTSCTKNAQISDITVKVNADVETNQSSAFMAVTNYGTLDNVTVSVGGRVFAKKDKESEIIFGGIVGGNANTISNCTVNYDNLILQGETAANASFGGIVGYNNGLVQGCTVTGAISADTFDLGGACYYNNYALSHVVNRADLTQVSNDEDWSPIVAGITVESMSLVEYCQSTGNLTVTGKDQAICGGIAAHTYNENNYCYAAGEITVTAQAAYVGGIYGISRVARDNFYTKFYRGFADHCISEVSINATLGHGESCIGGIAGLIQQAHLGKDIYSGGVTNCIFMGGIDVDSDYCGAVVGVCGEAVYEENSYTEKGKTYVYFEKNYYVANSLPSFGATVRTETEQGDDGQEESVEIFTRVGGKGATALTKDEIKNSELYNDILIKLGLETL